MELKELIGEEWVNITPYLFPCMSNMGDSTEWQINLGLYADTVEKKMLSGGDIGAVTGQGIVLRKNHPDYIFRLIRTVLGELPDYRISDSAFIIMAKVKKK